MLKSLSPLVAVALLAGCQGQVKDVQLDEFKSCTQFERYMRKMAKREVAWNWGGFGRVSFVAVNDMEMADEAAAPGDIGNGSGGANSYSTTNIQEEGVDEDDLMKTDGSYIYALAGDHLVISRAWPLESAGQVSAINIDGDPAGLYLVGDKVIVLSNLWWGVEPNPASDEGTEWRDDTPGTVVTVVDISTLSSPRILRETYVTGQYRESRIVDGELFVVTYEDLHVGWAAGGRAAQLSAINKSDLDDYQSVRFDNIRDGDSWQSATNPACGCTETFASDQEGGTYVTTVSALDLSDPFGAWKASSVVGEAGTVYASSTSLYIGYTIWPDTAFTGRNTPTDTVLHKFDISGDAPEYRATAQVNGFLNDQFSLSERGDVLFAALTTEEPSNGIVALREEGGQFEEVGSVGGLAPGEAIFAARFLGNLAYLVTYEVWLGDPLFTVDIADPTNMRATGELAVTGFSNYLHPLDENHLLSVGLDDLGGQSDWKLAVSLFDVSDLDDPQLKDREILDAWNSEAQSEHHAFNYFAPTQSLSIPSWAWEGQTVLEVLHADENEVYSIGQVRQAMGLNDDYWCSPIRRSVVMEDTVWALSSAGMTAAKIESPDETLAQVQYSGIDPCGSTPYWEDRW